jgi:hypothetical protein
MMAAPTIKTAFGVHVEPQRIRSASSEIQKVNPTAIKVVRAA